MYMKCCRDNGKVGGTCRCSMYVLIQGGVLDVKKSGQGTLPDAGTFLGCRKVGFWFPLARKKLEIHFSTPEAGLSGQ